ncbi:MAG: glycosyltransferase family 4 protein [Proteobacteria bacterium]|nr:glycosyltransferase family 4 protein [Pseudomonadota bacterium]
MQEPITSSKGTKPIRVLTVSKPYVSQAYRSKLLTWAASGRFVVGLVCPNQWGSLPYEGEPEVGIQTWRLPLVFNGRNHFHFYRGLEEVVRTFRPDILNIEEEHYSLVTWQCFRLALKYHAKPLFYTWQNIDKNYPAPFSWLEQYVFRHAAAAIGGNSESLAIIQRKGFKGPTAEIIQMGVDLARFTPKDWSETYKRTLRLALGLRPDSFWVGFFGRLVPEKGLPVLLQALETIKKSSSVDIQVLMAGSGPERDSLLSLAGKLGIADFIVWKDQVKSTDVPELLQAMDVLCLPSLTILGWKEQFGRILAEAMAAGTITAGSSSGEIPTVISDVGLVTPEGDSKTLAAALIEIAGDAGARTHLRERARARVLENYSNDIIADKFAKLFEKVAGMDKLLG